MLLAPVWVQYLFDMALVATSSLWLVRNWQRSPALYSRENLAERFRRQLAKLGLDVGRFLEGRSLGDLNPDEVYVLARVLPDFGSEQRRSLEDQVRLSGYRRSLERLLRLQRQLDGAEETVGTLACRFSIPPPAPRDAPSCCSIDWSRSSSACAALPGRTSSRIHGWSACWRSGCAIATSCARRRSGAAWDCWRPHRIGIRCWSASIAWLQTARPTKGGQPPPAS